MIKRHWIKVDWRFDTRLKYIRIGYIEFSCFYVWSMFRYTETVSEFFVAELTFEKNFKSFLPEDFSSQQSTMLCSIFNHYLIAQIFFKSITIYRPIDFICVLITGKTCLLFGRFSGCSIRTGGDIGIRKVWYNIGWASQ